jgi:hypothetical protein
LHFLLKIKFSLVIQTYSQWRPWENLWDLKVSGSEKGFLT